MPFFYFVFIFGLLIPAVCRSTETLETAEYGSVFKIRPLFKFDLSHSKWRGCQNGLPPRSWPDRENKYINKQIGGKKKWSAKIRSALISLRFQVIAHGEMGGAVIQRLSFPKVFWFLFLYLFTVK